MKLTFLLLVPGAFGALLKSLEGLHRRGRVFWSAKDRKTYRRVVSSHPFHKGTGEEDSPLAFFDLGSPRIDDDGGRYAYLLVKDFLEAGFRVVISDRYRFWATSGRKRLKKLLEHERFELFPAGRIPGKASIAISDRKRTIRDARASREQVSTLFVSYKKRMPASDGEISFPYFPYPDLLARGFAKKATKNEDRPVRICFAGRHRKRTHARPVIKRKFGKMPRHDVLETLEEHFGERTRLLGTSDFQEKSLPGAIFAKPGNSSLLRIGDYVHLLSSSDFFVAAPGGVFPLAHNLAEAMILGCIPLLEHPEYMSPPLEDGVHCIAFSGASSLRPALDGLLAMPGERIRELRANVFRYARRNLEIGSFSRALGNKEDFHKTLLPYFFHALRFREIA